MKQRVGLYFFYLFILIPISHLKAQVLREYQFPKEVQSDLSKESRDTGKVNVLLDYAAQIFQSNPSQGITYSFYALQLARKAKAEDHIDRALLRMGKFLFQQGAYEEGMVYHDEYFQRALKSGNIINQLKARHNITAIKLTINNKYDEAAYREMQSLLKDYDEVWLKSRDSSLMKETIPGLLVNIANVALLGGLFEDANAYVKRGYAIAETYPILEQIYLQLLIVDINVKSKLGVFQEAFEQGSKALAICRQSNNLFMSATINYYLGNTCVEKKAPDEAINYYVNAFKIAQKLGNQSVLASSANKLSEIYQKKGDVAEALKFSSAAQQSKEATNSLQAASKIAQVEMLERLDLLEKQMEKERRSNTIRIGLISAVLLVAVIAGLSKYRSVRKKYRQARTEKLVYAKEAEKNLEEKHAIENELEIKKKELTTETLQRIQKHEIIQEAILKLKIAQRQQENEGRKYLIEATNVLERALDSDSWDDFELRFLQVHQDFYERLHALYPVLTNNEKRLSAFLKLGLNSKEISAVTGQSPRSIVVARHRLRKKLGIEDKEISLTEFFDSI